MKKLIILFLCLFLFTGCSNYHEINDLAIVSAIGLEHDEEKFKVTLELYKEVKEGNSSKEESISINGTGKTIDEAINNSSLMSETLLYFSHVQAIVIDYNYAKEGITEMMDYLSRNTDFSFVSYIVVSDENNKPSDILSKKNDLENEIVGKAIANLFNTTEQNNSIFVSNKYYNFLTQYVNKRQDVYLPIIKVQDKKIKLSEMVVFKNDKLVKKLDMSDTETFSLLTNNTDSLFYKVNYDDSNVVLRIYEGKTKYKIRNGKIVIDINVTSDIDEITGNVNTMEEDVIQKIKISLENTIKENIINLINILRVNNSDALGLQDLLYDIYGKKESDWKNFKIEIKINNNITKKGLLMNPIRGGYEKN